MQEHPTMDITDNFLIALQHGNRGNERKNKGKKKVKKKGGGNA